LVPRFCESGVPFIRVNDLAGIAAGDIPRLTIEPEQSAEYRRTVVAAGDVLVSVVGSLDKVAVVPAHLAGANIARAVCRLVPRSGIDSQLLALWMQTREYLDQAFRETVGDTAQATLNMSDLARFDVHFPAPDLAEQFAARLASRLQPIERTSRSLSRQISLLHERRLALITAAVTGQIEIPGVAA
jgi:type I restriction enzyme S subunit